MEEICGGDGSGVAGGKDTGSGDNQVAVSRRGGIPYRNTRHPKAPRCEKEMLQQESGDEERFPRDGILDDEKDAYVPRRDLARAPGFEHLFRGCFQLPREVSCCGRRLPHGYRWICPSFLLLEPS